MASASVKSVGIFLLASSLLLVLSLNLFGAILG